MDKIFIAYPHLSWNYSKSGRIRNPTSLQSINQLIDAKVEVIEGVWEHDEDTRNELLEAARMQGFDWMIIQDADEFYTQESWLHLKKKIKSSHDYDVINVPLFTFWKSTEFVIEEPDSGIKAGRACFAVNCMHNHINFEFSRTTNSKSIYFVDEPCYHYSYVLSDRDVQYKIKTWAHSNDIFSRRLWYQIKWKRWRSKSQHLHPGSPWVWRRAIRFPLPQPSFAAEIEGYETVVKDIGLFWASIELLYDHLSWWRHVINNLKRLAKATFIS